MRCFYCLISLFEFKFLLGGAFIPSQISQKAVGWMNINLQNTFHPAIFFIEVLEFFEKINIKEKLFILMNTYSIQDVFGDRRSPIFMGCGIKNSARRVFIFSRKFSGIGVPLYLCGAELQIPHGGNSARRD